MRAQRHIVYLIAGACFAALLALSLFSAPSLAQSKDDRKERKGSEQKREEPQREKSAARETSRGRTARREPVRERKERPARDRKDRKERSVPSRSEGSARDRSSGGERRANRDRSLPDRKSSSGERTTPERSSSDGSPSGGRRPPPREPREKDYDRSRDDDRAGTRPDTPVGPPRRRIPVDGSLIRKEAPEPDDRVRIIIEGWPSPPPWYPHRLVKRYIWERLPTYEPYLIHLPFGTIRPEGIEDEFLLLLGDLWRDGMRDALLVCIFQTYRAMDVDRFELFFGSNEEAIVYGSFTPNSFLALVPVESIYELMNDPRIRWIGEYKPYYKINSSVKLWEYDGAFVFSLEGDDEEFREDLESISLPPEYYDEEIGFYFVPAEGYDLEALSEFWWVAEVLQVVSDPDLVYGYNNKSYE